MSPEVANTTYLWVGVVVGLIAIIGTGGGLLGLIRYLKRQGVRDDKLDELIDPETGVMARMATHEKDVMARFAQLDKNLKPNGLNTNQVGDVVKRTENAVNDMASKLDQHIGASDQTHKDLWKELRRKRDKEES